MTGLACITHFGMPEIDDEVEEEEERERKDNLVGTVDLIQLKETKVEGNGIGGEEGEQGIPMETLSSRMMQEDQDEEEKEEE